MGRAKRGLFVGRFQPIHIGHVESIKDILETIEEIIIIIGSSQKSHEKENPFTSGERMMMLRLALYEAGISPERYFIVPIPDLQSHSLWVAQVFSYSPPFNIVYSNEPLTRRLFKEAGIVVKNISFFKREIFSATEVRKRILLGEDWKVLVPKSVSEYIDKINGVERIKELAITDSPLKKKLN